MAEVLGECGFAQTAAAHIDRAMLALPQPAPPALMVSALQRRVVVTLLLADFGLSVEDSPPADCDLVDGVGLEFDGAMFDVIHTPGHTPGGVCLRRGDQMLVGDTLFAGSVGRTDLPGGDWDALIASIREKLFMLPDDVRCLPGHEGETTIGRERRTNPFVGEVARGSAR